MRKWLGFFFWLVMTSAIFGQQSDTKPLHIQVVQHQAVMVWTATTSSGVSGYHVWRSATSGFGYVQIGATSTSVLTFTDTSAKGNTTYFWVVTAYSPACPATPTCGESLNSNEVTATIPSP